MDEQRIVRLAAVDRDKLEMRASDLHVGATVDGDIRLETRDLFQIEALAKEALTESLRRTGRARELIGIVGARVNLEPRIHAAKIAMAANVVPMGVRHDNGGQLR